MKNDLDALYIILLFHDMQRILTVQNEKLTPERLAHVFSMRLKTLNFNDAAAEVRPFLRGTTQLNEWSESFFLYWFSKIKFLDGNKS